MQRYLYGGSIKGIHEFIAKTNRLQEIVGASFLLQNIEKFIEEFEPLEIYVEAAANMKALFDQKSIKDVVSDMPKKVLQSAYGVTFVQAVVKIKGEKPTKEEFEELEKLLAAQRNRTDPPLDLAFGVVKKSPRTARAAVERVSDELIDMATRQKRKAYTNYFTQERKEDLELENKKELSHLTNKKNKYAIIHADGNGLGTIIPKYIDAGHNLRELSVRLDRVTRNAFEKAKSEVRSRKIRKLFLSGDDLMVIVDPDYALEFTKSFLEWFERLSEEERVTAGLTPKLTACAGIVFVNEKYPFHYGLRLAEELGKAAKKVSKSLVNPQKQVAPSSLLFHNIQSGHFDLYEDIVEEELTIRTKSGKIRFDFGPYFLHRKGDLPTIDDVMELRKLFEDRDAPLSKLRSWIPLLRQNEEMAQLQLDRIHEIARGKWSGYQTVMDKLEQMGIDPETMLKEDRSVIYDILQLHAVTGEV